MADFRLLGSETTVRLTKDGALLSEITTVKDVNFKIGVKLITEGYLGELANRHREIFEECSGSFNIVPENNSAFQLQKGVYLRALQAGASDLQVNLGLKLAFPSGVMVKLTFPDLHFETTGDFSAPSRDAFTTMAWSWKTTKYIPSF